MKIVEIIPFSKTLRKNHLSYFTTRDITVGNIVSIDIRKKLTNGLVVKVKDVKDSKEELKSSSFKMRKIKGVLKNTIFNNHFIKMGEKCSDYFATSTGSILQALIPAIILENIRKLNVPKKRLVNKGDCGKYIIQGDDSERESHYRNLIRESFSYIPVVVYFSVLILFKVSIFDLSSVTIILNLMSLNFFLAY